jgi:hypothetical protein
MSEESVMSEGELRVDSFSGYKGEVTPRRFTADGADHAVAEIIGKWYTDTHLYFRVRTTAQGQYVLRYDLDHLTWELVMRETDK